MPIKNQGEAHNRAIPSGIFQAGDTQGGLESKCAVMSCDLTTASCDLVACQMAILPTRSDHGHQCTPPSQDLFYTTRFAPKEVQTQENTSQVLKYNCRSSCIEALQTNHIPLTIDQVGLTAASRPLSWVAAVESCQPFSIINIWTAWPPPITMSKICLWGFRGTVSLWLGMINTPPVTSSEDIVLSTLCIFSTLRMWGLRSAVSLWVWSTQHQ